MSLTFRGRRWWLFLGLVEVMFAVLLASGIDRRWSAGTRYIWGALYALFFTLAVAVAVVVMVISYLILRKRFRERLAAGVVLESRFGDDFLVLRGPWAESTLRFEGLASVRVHRGWVLLQQKGSPIAGVWPAELFPEADLSRLMRTVHGSKPVRTG